MKNRNILIAGVLVLLLTCGVCWWSLQSGYAFEVGHRSTINRNQRLWETTEPSIYSMQVTSYEHGRRRTWEVIVENGRARNEASSANQEWLYNNNHTVEDIFKAAEEFCISSSECTMEFDPQYHYLAVWGTSWRGMRVEQFEVCQELQFCGTNGD